MKAELRAYFSPDTPNIDAFAPADANDFGVLLGLVIGATGQPSVEDHFNILVCSRTWKRQNQQNLMEPQHMMIVANFALDDVLSSVRNQLLGLEADEWGDLALQVDRFAKWSDREFAELHRS